MTSPDTDEVFEDTPYPLLTGDIDLADVREQLSVALGREVAVVASWPDGDTPGRLIVREEGTERPLAVPPAVLDAAIATAAQRERQRDDGPVVGWAPALLADLTAATTDAARWDVVRRLLQRLAARDAADRADARAARQAWKRTRREAITAAREADAQVARFVNPRDTSRPGVAFTRAQRIALVAERRRAEQERRNGAALEAGG